MSATPAPLATDEQVTYRPVGTGYEVVRNADRVVLGTVRRADTGKGWRAENIAGAMIGAGHGRRMDAARQLLEERERHDAYVARGRADERVTATGAELDVLAARAAALDALPTDDEPVDVFEGVSPTARGRLLLQAAARAAGLYSVETTASGIVGMHATPQEADTSAERFRAEGIGASVLRPCGHEWNRYAPAVECQGCASIRSLRSLRSIGGHLNPSSRARLEAWDTFEARLDAIDAEAPSFVAELEQHHGGPIGVAIGHPHVLSTYVTNRREELRPVAAVPTIPSEASIATARQAEVVSEARGLEELTPAAVQGLTAAGAAIAEPTVHLMSSDLLDACETATRGGGLSLAPYTTPERITCPRCRELASQEAEAAQELLADLSRELGGEPVEANPVDALQELRLGVRTNREQLAPRAVRHVAAVLRGTLRQAVEARELEEGDGERHLEARYEDARGDRIVRARVTTAVRLLADAGLVTVYRHPRGEWSTVNATEAGDRLLDELPFLGSPAAVLDRQ